MSTTGSPRRWRRAYAIHALAIAASLALGACGGGGGPAGTPFLNESSGGSTPPIPSGVSTGPAGPSASFAQQCAANNSLAEAGLRTATLGTEKQWLRAYFDEAYLWRDEVPAVDPGAASFSGADVYVAMDNYFEALKTPQVTATGQRRDRFSFTYETAKWNALLDSAAEAGYGIGWKLTSATPPRQIRVAFVEPGSPADRAGLVRGDALVSADGIGQDTSDTAGVDGLNAALFPAGSGESHRFVFTRADGSTLNLGLTSASVTLTPVPLARVLTTPAGTRAGYLLFNDHVAPAEAQLISAIEGFRSQGVSELVLDLRYNGGGYLYIASELATMVAGSARTAGQSFASLRFNARRAAENASTPFYDTSCILSQGGCTQSNALPMLNLSRVVVLAQSDTCSASEAIVNSLRGVGVDVVLIGGTTCGKPYGFTAKDNCGISYLPIEFMSVNAQGFGDYADGFEPSLTGTAGTRFVKGCSVADDTGHALGDAAEGMLASALGYIDRGSCPVLAGAAPGQAKAQQAVSGEGAVALVPRRHPGRSNAIWRPR